MGILHTEQIDDVLSDNERNNKLSHEDIMATKKKNVISVMAFFLMCHYAILFNSYCMIRNNKQRKSNIN